MSIFEYDEEKHMKSERKEWREIGYREGHAVGREEGCTLLSQLLKSLMDAGKNEELQRALSDSEYREKLLREYLPKTE